ncbi:MAG TPA: Rrf2 family transcriptional regulator [Anaerolineaceae bacterium]|jgi:Rrf2 family protein
MFRVSRRVDYGLRLLIALAADQNTGSQATSRLADRLDIPLAFLHQIGRSLIQAGILRSSPGPGGGLRLNQPADDITLLQVLEILDGPVRLSACLEQPDCSEDPDQPSARAWANIQESLVDQMSQIRLNYLVEQAKAQAAIYFPINEYSASSKALAV